MGSGVALHGQGSAIERDQRRLSNERKHREYLEAPIQSPGEMIQIGWAAPGRSNRAASARNFSRRRQNPSFAETGAPGRRRREPAFAERFAHSPCPRSRLSVLLAV